jgi:hypothetical protein
MFQQHQAALKKQFTALIVVENSAGYFGNQQVQQQL